jgi:hypothetical protein
MHEVRCGMEALSDANISMYATFDRYRAVVLA